LSDSYETDVRRGGEQIAFGSEVLDERSVGE